MQVKDTLETAKGGEPAASEAALTSSHIYIYKGLSIRRSLPLPLQLMPSQHAWSFGGGGFQHNRVIQLSVGAARPGEVLQRCIVMEWTSWAQVTPSTAPAAARRAWSFRGSGMIRHRVVHLLARSPLRALGGQASSGSDFVGPINVQSSDICRLFIYIYICSAAIQTVVVI